MTPGRLPSASPEARLIFLTAGPDGPVVREQVSRLLGEPLSWMLVTWLAEREKAASRLHHLIRARHADEVDSKVLTHLEHLARVEAFRALVLEQRMDQLLDRLTEEGIPVLVLKGAAVARSCYPTFSDRPMGDIDLLVPPAKAREARSIAEADGWRIARGVIEEHFPAEDHQHLPPMDDGTALRLGLDIHTRLSSQWEPAGFAPRDVWDRSLVFPQPAATSPSTSGEVVEASPRVPDPADLLLHACIHFAWSHGLAFGGWKTFRDASVILGHPGFDAGDFLARVRHARAEAFAYWTLRMARDLAAVEIPDDLLRSLEPNLPRWVRHRVARHFAYELCDVSGLTPIRLRRWFWEVGVSPARLGIGSTRPWSDDDLFHDVKIEVADGSEAEERSASDEIGVGGEPTRIERWGAGARHLRRVLLNDR